MTEALTNCVAFSTRFFSMALVGFILIIVLVGIIRWQASAQKSRYYKELKEKQLENQQKQIELTNARIASMQQEAVQRREMMKDNTTMFQTLKAITKNLGANTTVATVPGAVNLTQPGIPGAVNLTQPGIPGTTKTSLNRLVPMTSRGIPYNGRYYSPTELNSLIAAQKAARSA